MKLQLNTTDKTVTLEEAVKIGDLTDILEKLLPGEWKTFTLEVKVIQNWSNPIIIKEYPTYPWRPYWWTNTPIYNQVGSTIQGINTKITLGNTLTNSNGIYNLDISN